MEDLFGIAIRVSVMYVYVLMIFRLSGKRSMASISPLDFLVATIIGDLFDDVIWAEVPLIQGIVAFTTLIALHMLVSFAEYKSDWIHRLVASSRTPVVRQGQLLRDGMRRERVSEDEVFSQLRLQGEDELDEIQDAGWEPNGEVSIIKRTESKSVQKKDLPRLKGLISGTR